MKTYALKALYCVTVFLSASLLFVLEPLAGKLTVPAFGGTAGVWSVCLVFFQFVVLVGYLTTWLISSLRPSRQLLIYFVLAAVSVGWSTIPREWQCTNFNEPVLPLLVLLFNHLAVPSILLSTISGMMQVWFRLAGFGNPYPLYSLSNIGSLSALIAYPLVIEPALTVSQTLLWWRSAYILLLGMIATTIILSSQKLQNDPAEEIDDSSSARIKPSLFCWWSGLAAAGSLALIAYTTRITSDVAPVPLLWILPLAVYLASFVVVFARQSYYRRGLFMAAWIPLSIMEPRVENIGYGFALVTNLLLLFSICMVCHGELVLRKPEPRSLPIFYLAMSLGGMLGGVAANFVCPAVFAFEVERFIVLLIIACLCLWVAFGQRRLNKPVFKVALLLGLIGLVWKSWTSWDDAGVVLRQRNFYSSVRVIESNGVRALAHGRIIHGEEFLDPARAGQPAGPYWPPLSLLNQFMRFLHPGEPLSYGEVGLGTGVIAAFGQPADQMRIYELDPKIRDIANRYFSFIKSSRATVQVIVGDGRTMLANEKDTTRFDLLVIDAFNGDAVPTHLLTKEALAVYLKRIPDDGVLCFNVTNRFINLVPVLASTASSLGLTSCVIMSEGGVRYVAISRSALVIKALIVFSRQNSGSNPRLVVKGLNVRPDTKIWTDDYVNLLSVVR